MRNGEEGSRRTVIRERVGLDHRVEIERDVAVIKSARPQRTPAPRLAEKNDPGRDGGARGRPGQRVGGQVNEGVVLHHRGAVVLEEDSMFTVEEDVATDD